ncbi:DUF732 domain-containing protein [Mycobacterium sp. THU-M104]|uniref:DUF732 domain-containing protein n=1 Tax=Mycobacterium sp. THU-M104 TaxID=3410515 RepID=UPI003B9BA8DF
MRFSAALVGFGVMLGMAVPAHADGADDQFLATLQAAGLTYADPGRAIAAGKEVCTMAGRGTQLADIVRSVQKLNPKLAADNAARFTAIAADVYCPDALSTGPAPPNGD